MNNEKYKQIIDEAYDSWCKQFEVDSNNFNADELVKGYDDQCWGYPILHHVKPTSKEYKRGQINAYLEGKAEKPFFYLTQEEFINKCKTDVGFSEKWRLKIEERELSLDERNDLLNKETNRNHKRENCFTDEEFERETLQDCKAFNIPTKLITITYKNETIESYE